MSSLTKLQEEMKSTFDKASDELNLMITNKIKSLDLIDNLVDLKIKMEKIEKISNNGRLEVKKIEDMIRNVLDEFKTENTEELKLELRFLTLTNRSFKKLSDYEEEKEAKKVKENVLEEIDRFKTKIKGIKKLIIETIDHDSSKLISDLNFEKGLITDKIKDIEIKVKNTKNIKKNY